MVRMQPVKQLRTEPKMPSKHVATARKQAMMDSATMSTSRPTHENTVPIARQRMLKFAGTEKALQEWTTSMHRTHDDVAAGPPTARAAAGGGRLTAGLGSAVCRLGDCYDFYEQDIHEEQDTTPRPPGGHAPQRRSAMTL